MKRAENAHLRDRDPVWFLRDALARVTSIREALADVDPFDAAALARDLEHDLAGALALLEEVRRAT